MGRHSDFLQPWTGFRPVLSLIVISGVLWPYAFSIGAPEATFTLVNKTTRYLHAIVNNKPTVYIAPGTVVTYDVTDFRRVVAEVRYSPGQGVKGSAARAFPFVVHTSKTSTTNDCYGRDCKSTTESEKTQSVDPITWAVTEADLEPN